MVLASGKIEVCSIRTNFELFWAARGAFLSPLARSSLTSLRWRWTGARLHHFITFRAFKKQPMVFFAELVFSADKAGEVAEACGVWDKSTGEQQALVVAITCVKEVRLVPPS
mgnify:FL=1